MGAFNPVPSRKAVDFYANVDTVDEFVSSPNSYAVTRTGKQIYTIAGMNLQMAQAVQAFGYMVLGDYIAGLNFTNYNQVFKYAGEFYKPAPTTPLPYLLTGVTGTDLPKFVAIGDASLRQALAAASGTNVIGFGSRTLFQKLGEHVSCKDAPFNCVGDGVTDDTVGMQAFFTYLASQVQSGPTTSGAITAAYSGTGPKGYIPYGTYKLTAPISVGPYTEIVGEDSILKQYDDNSDILLINLYQFRMSGMQFVGGRQHLVFTNANTNSSMLRVENCQFFLSRHYSVKTASNDPLWTHLSTNGEFVNCRWISCHQVMDNCCDSMVLEECWVQPDSTNLSASTAVFNNRGATPTDPTAQTRLRFKGGFYIPAVGTYGVDRPANIRWVDNWGTFLSDDARFGGEFGGMRIVDHLAANDTTFPWNTTEVRVRGGLAFSGPSNDPNACILGLQAQVPQRITLGGFSGSVSSRLIANLSSTDLPAYFTAWAAAAGRPAYEYFKFDLINVITDVRAYTPLRPMIPDTLYDYMLRGRRTMVQRITDQLLTKGTGVNNPVTFTSATFDTVGAFRPAFPTRIYMPNGCNSMELEINLAIDAADATAKPIRVQVRDSGGTEWKADAKGYGVNTFANDVINWTVKVYGPPDSWWDINISHGAATDRNLKSARVVATPINHIV